MIAAPDQKLYNNFDPKEVWVGYITLAIRSEEQAAALHKAIRRWKGHTSAKKTLQSFMREAKNLTEPERITRELQVGAPLKVVIRPHDLDQTVQLAEVLNVHDSTATMARTVESYLAQQYPEDSVAVKFAGPKAMTRLRNALLRGRFLTLTQIRDATDAELLDVRGIAEPSLQKIREIVG